MITLIRRFLLGYGRRPRAGAIPAPRRPWWQRPPSHAHCRCLIVPLMDARSVQPEDQPGNDCDDEALQGAGLGTWTVRARNVSVAWDLGGADHGYAVQYTVRRNHDGTGEGPRFTLTNVAIIGNGTVGET